jgi:hypothetical protein
LKIGIYRVLKDPNPTCTNSKKVPIIARTIAASRAFFTKGGWTKFNQQKNVFVKRAIF